MQLYMKTRALAAKFTDSIGGSRESIAELKRQIKNLAAKFTRKKEIPVIQLICYNGGDDYSLRENDTLSILAAERCGLLYLPIEITVQTTLRSVFGEKKTLTDHSK